MKNILRMAMLCGSVLCGAPPLLAAGALAIDTNQGDQWGWAIDHASEADARQRALRECGSGCRIVMTFSGACAAYAADQANASTAYGWAWGHPDAGSGTAPSSVTTTLAAMDDNVADPDETAIVSGSLDGEAFGSPQTVTITDDEGVPALTLVLTPEEVTEGGTATVTATVSPSSSEPFTVAVSAEAVSPAQAPSASIDRARVAHRRDIGLQPQHAAQRACSASALVGHDPDDGLAKEAQAERHQPLGSGNAVR